MAASVDDHLSARVMAFTARQLGYNIEKVGLESRLLEDLGLDGDDAGEFFQAFAREFAVDLHDFSLSRHFGPEGMPLRVTLAALLIIGLAAALAALLSWWIIPFLLAALVLLLGYRYRKSQRSSPGSIRVLHLVQAAAAQRWVLPGDANFPPTR